MSSAEDIQNSAQSSTSTVVSAIILNGAIFAAEFSLFLLLRPRFKQIYSPKTFRGPAEERTEELPSGLLNWIPTWLRLPTRGILEHQGLDAFVFIEYHEMMIWILAPITVLSWIVLFPLYAAQSGGGQTGLNRLSSGNIGETKQQQLRHIGTLLIQWIATSWILYNIRTRMTKFITLRQDFLISSKHSNTSQAKTVLITGIPNELLSNEKLKRLYSKVDEGAKDVWINRDLGDLPDLVDERAKWTNKLESAEAKVIKIAYKKSKKNQKKGKGAETFEMESEGEATSLDLVSKFLDRKERPTHKLGLLGCFGEKVDSLDWCPKRIAELNQLIESKRDEVDNDFAKYPPQNSAFILYNTQIGAHQAFKAIAHHLPYRMADNYIEAHPLDVVWSNVSMNPYDKKIRGLIGWAITMGLIIWWTIPVAFIGVISNVQGLADRVSWLSWLNNIGVATGIIQSILPSVLLSVLNALLPIFLRLVIRVSGVPTYTGIELSLMTRFFLFQIIQNFLFLTIVSGVSGGVNEFVESIANDPAQIPGLLAEYIPIGSTFFITFLLLQGLAGSAGTFLQIATLAIYYLKKILLGGTPRKVWHIDHDMSFPKMGTLFPTIELMSVVALGYMVIAPVVSGFALLAFVIYYFLYKYMFTFVYDAKPQNETSGLFFPKAINHLLSALYLEMVMLATLFFVAQDDQGNQSAIPEGAFMIVLIVIVVAFHYFLYDSFSDLYTALPLSLVTSGSNFKSAETQPLLNESADGSGSPTEEKAFVPPQVNGSNEEAQQSEAFVPPSLRDQQRTIWIPNDKFGIGNSQVVALRSLGLDATNDFTSFDLKDRVEVDAYQPPGEVLL